MVTSSFNLARFDFTSVRLAIACAQTGSLTAAARESHLALAAASRRIRELEAAVGAPLFERHPRGLTTTPAGRLLVKYGLALLQSTEMLDLELADLRQGVAQHVRLWASTAAINQFLPPLLSRYDLRRPEVRIDLEEQVSAVVIAALLDGRADVGIFVDGPDSQRLTQGLITRPFATDELVLVLPVKHALARHRKPIAFEDTLSENYIGLSAGAALLQRQQETALAAGRHLKLRVQVRSFDAVCHMVESDLGIAVLPKAAVTKITRSMHLAMRPLSDAWARRLMLVASRADENSEAALDLMEFLAAAPSPTAKPAPRKKQ